MSSPERRLYEDLSDEEWIAIFEGRTAIPRTITDWNETVTPSLEDDSAPLEEPSEYVLRFADATGLPKGAAIVELGAGNGRNLAGLYERGWDKPFWN